MSHPISVLHVDDDPSITDLTATFLERENDRLTVETAVSADEGLNKISDSTPDCIVSDYNMPGMDGIEFLQAVREEHLDLPFILFTGKGSESVASDAIAADATDYLQKRSGSEQYELLANRLQKAVQARREAERANRQEELMQLTEFAGDTGGFEIDVETDKVLLTPGAERILAPAEDAESTIETGLERFHPEDREEIRRTIQRAVETGEQQGGIWRYQPPEGDQQLLQGTVTKTSANGDATTLRGAINDITDQKERDQQLQQSRDLMANIEQLADGGAWEYDSETGQLMLTDGAHRLYGHDPDTDLTLEEAFNAIHPEDRDLLRDRFDTCLETGEPYEIEIRLITADGGQRWITARGERVNKQQSGTTIRGYIQDVTERKEHKTELEEYETIIGSLTDAVYVINEEGQFTYVNDEFVELVGYDRETILRNTPSLIKDGETVERAEDQLGRLLSSEGPDTVTFEVTIQPRDGDPIVCEDHMGVLPYEGDQFDGSVGTLRDITDRKERKQKLELVETLFANAQECQFIVDVADGEFELRHANDYYKRTVGLSPGEPVTGQTPTDLFGEAGGREILDRYTTCVETRDSVAYTVEVPVPEEGTVYRTILEPVVTDDTVTHIVGTARDITDLKRREEQLKRQNERLEEFTSVVSHDLRNPLRVADGRLELIQEECESDHIDDVAGALGRMDALIDDLLTLARGGDLVGEIEPVVLADLVDDCWQNIAAPGAEIVSTIDRTIRADRSRLQQLLENIFRNAVEHGNGNVTVAVGEVESGFYVGDDGPGIPEEDRDDVFEAGYTTSSDGTGFGLRIVEQIAEAHDWTVTVTESTDGGARFEITGVER